MCDDHWNLPLKWREVDVGQKYLETSPDTILIFLEFMIESKSSNSNIVSVLKDKFLKTHCQKIMFNN